MVRFTVHRSPFFLFLAIALKVNSYICIPPFCTPNCQDELARCDNGPDYCIDGSPDCWDSFTTIQVTDTIDNTATQTSTITSVLVQTITSVDAQVSVDTVTETETETETITADDTTSTIFTTETVTPTAIARRGFLHPRENIKTFTEEVIVSIDTFETEYQTEYTTTTSVLVITSYDQSEVTVTEFVTETETSSGEVITVTSTISETVAGEVSTTDTVTEATTEALTGSTAEATVTPTGNSTSAGDTTGVDSATATPSIPTPAVPGFGVRAVEGPRGVALVACLLAGLF